MRGGCQRWQGAPWFALVPIGLGVFFLPLRDRRHLQGRRRRPVILIALGALLLILALTTRFGEGGLVVPFVLPALGIVLLPAGSRSRHGAGRASRSRPGPPASTCRCRTAWPPGSGSAAGWRARTSMRADSLAWATSSARPATTWRRIAPTSASRGALARSPSADGNDRSLYATRFLGYIIGGRNCRPNNVWTPAHSSGRR